MKPPTTFGLVPENLYLINSVHIMEDFGHHFTFTEL